MTVTFGIYSYPSKSQEKYMLSRPKYFPSDETFRRQEFVVKQEFMFSQFQITNWGNPTVFKGVGTWVQYCPKVYVMKYMRHRFFLFWLSSELISDSDHAALGPGVIPREVKTGPTKAQSVFMELSIPPLTTNDTLYTTAFGSRIPNSTRLSKTLDNLDL